MSTIDLDPLLDPSRTRRLRAATHDAHERLDERIMAGTPFASRTHYTRFLRVQHRFHQEIDTLYGNAALDGILPDLKGRRRVDLIERDLIDLDVTPLLPERASVFDSNIDLPTALGWLYTAEGSNLGAAFLLKDARKLGLSETFGARHLAAAPEGRGLHCKTFTAALDDLGLDAAAEDRAIAGACAAFGFVKNLVDTFLPRDADGALRRDL